MAATISVLPTRLAIEHHADVLERTSARSLRLVATAREQIAEGIADFERIAAQARAFGDDFGGDAA